MVIMRIISALILATVFVVSANAAWPPAVSDQVKLNVVPEENNIITAVNKTTTQQRINFLNNLQQNTSWRRLNINGLLQRGGSHPELTEIKRRLILLQDLVLKNLVLQELTEPSDLEVSAQHQTSFTSELTTAIIYFQKRHGLKPDGIIGPRTIAWLNISPAQRAQLLIQNMLRQQQFFKRVTDSYLLVNIPQFQLSLIEQGKLILNSKVIVGKRKRPTPVIDAQIRSLVVNPFWNVPRSIVHKDLLPKIRNNNNFLAEGNYEVYDYSGNQLRLDDFDWARLASGRFPYTLRQKPGPANTLGRVKLYFDNEYSVYLHDTPNKELFNHYSRTFSSGCVRVEKANELARWFGRQRVIDQEHWLKAIKDPYENRWLKLNEPLTLHLVYWTAWVDKTNNTQFRTDIYHKEFDVLKNNNLAKDSSADETLINNNTAKTLK